MISLASAALLLVFQAATPAATPAKTPSHDHAAAAAPTAPGIAATVQQNIRGIAKEFISVADAMPEAKFSFAPTAGEFKGVRTFGEQVAHVGDANFALANAVLKTKAPSEKPKTKAENMAYIKDSFDALDKAAATLTAENATEPMDSPFGGKSNPLGLLFGAATHSRDHYGQLIEYLRMNGIVPPPSRR